MNVAILGQKILCVYQVKYNKILSFTFYFNTSQKERIVRSCGSILNKDGYWITEKIKVLTKYVIC